MMGDILVADGALTRPHTFEEIGGVTGVARQMNFAGVQRFADDLGGFGHERITVHGDPAVRADETTAAIGADRFIRIWLAENGDAVGIFVAGTIALEKSVGRAGVIHVGDPLDDIVMVLRPIEFADIEGMRAVFSVEGKHRRGAEIKVPVKTLRHRLAFAEERGPGETTAVAISVNLLQLADAPAADEFRGHAELAAVFAALLGAGLKNAAITFDGGADRLAFLKRAGGRFFAIDVLAGGGGHDGHGGVP